LAKVRLIVQWLTGKRGSRAFLLLLGLVSVALVWVVIGGWGWCWGVASLAGVGLLWWLGCLFWRGRVCADDGNRILLTQTLVLAITLVGVGWYAWEAKKTADATEQLVWTTRIGQTGMFVTDPIWTVKEYPKHLNEHSGRGRTDNGEAGSIPTMDHIKEYWLAIEIVNEGAFRAVNITLQAEWLPCPSDEEGRGDMQPTPLCTAEIAPTLEKLNEEIGGLKNMGLKLKMWRRWDLASGESVLACLEAPCKEVCDDQRKLVLRWYDATYGSRTVTIGLNKQEPNGLNEKQGKWTTNWNDVSPIVGPFDD